MGPELLNKVLEELKAEVSGGVVSKVEQPDERNLMLKVFKRGGTRRIIISTDPRFSRMHLTDLKLPNPKTPKRFCAFLRKRITGARIKSISQRPGERIVLMEMEKSTNGVVSSYVLRAELTGKSSNVILLDSGGVVLDAMRYFRPGISPRIVTPGVVLVELPPPERPKEEALPERRPDESWNEAADRYYRDLMERESFNERLRRLRRALREAARRAERKLKNLYDDKRKALENVGLAEKANLLLSNLGKLRRGLTEVTVTDYTKLPPEEVRVALDSKLGPRENVERMFKLSKKAKRALELLARRIPEVEEELEYIDNLVYELERVETEDDLTGLEEEAAEAGYIKAPRPGAVKKRTEPILRFLSNEGSLILAGKNAKGNDLLLRKHASRGDVWLHACGVPGSHVLVKAAGMGGVSEKTLVEAASIAAWMSRARGSRKAEVIYTDVKNVKKPKGARPGMVEVKDYKTILVEPRLPEE